MHGWSHRIRTTSYLNDDAHLLRTSTEGGRPLTAPAAFVPIPSVVQLTVTDDTVLQMTEPRKQNPRLQVAVLFTAFRPVFRWEFRSGVLGGGGEWVGFVNRCSTLLLFA